MKTVPLSNGFSLWQDFILRGTGFSYDLLDPLKNETLFEEMLHWLEQERVLHKKREDLIQALDAAIPRVDLSEKKILRRLKKALWKKDTVEFEIPEEWKASLEAWFEEKATLHSHRASLAESFLQKQDQDLMSLVNLFQRQDLQKAILWQNPRLLGRGMRSFLQEPHSIRRKGQRDKKKLLMRYLQRYTSKNETIGFFGPYQWGSFKNKDVLMEHQPGESLVHRQWVSFEPWALERLSSGIFERDPLKGFRTIFISAESCFVDPLLYIKGRPLKLNERQRFLFQKLNRPQRRNLLVETLIKQPSPFSSSVELNAEIEALIKFGVLEQKTYLGMEEDGETRMGHIVANLPEARQAWETILKTKENLEDPDLSALGLERELKAMNGHFQHWGGAEPVRHPGKLYAGRTLLYPDALRSGEMTLGEDFLEKVREPLGLIMRSTRWLSHRVAIVMNQRVRRWIKAYPKKRVMALDLVETLHRNELYFQIAKEVKQEFSTRWRLIFGAFENETSLVFSSGELSEKVHQFFKVGQRPFPSAIYSCPDLLVGGTASNPLLVLGEIHVGMNMVALPVLLKGHPNPEEVRDRLKNDLPEPQLMHCPQMRGKGERIHRDAGLVKDFRLRFAGSPASGNMEHYLDIGELYLDQDDPGLTVKSMRSSKKVPLILFLEHFLKSASLNAYQLLPTLPSLPRIQVDDLVVQRRSWSFRIESLPFFHQDPFEQCLRILAWKGEKGLPDQVFVKVSGEGKPFYLDFQSQSSIELFVDFLRKSLLHGDNRVQCTLSEMLPKEGETWLQDADGNPYFSEFRLVGVDENWMKGRG